MPKRLAESLFKADSQHRFENLSRQIQPRIDYIGHVKQDAERPSLRPRQARLTEPCYYMQPINLSAPQDKPNMETPQTVFVVDDEPAVRRAVRLILESAGHQIQEFESAVEFMKIMDASQRGCVVSDVRMPGIDGIQFLKQLREVNFHLPVIVLTGHADVPMAVKAMQLGAIELLEKPVDPDVLRDRVAKALQSESQNHQQHLELAEIKACYESLSPREREVLGLLVAGKQPKMIANILGTAQSTVRIQRQSILKKMRVDNVYDLILLADQIDQIDR